MKTSKKMMMFAGIALVAVMLFSTISSTSASPAQSAAFREVTSTSDNGYKYPSVADSVVSAYYQEWWYFEVQDLENGIAFTVWYEIDNPANETAEMSLFPAAYTGVEGFVGDNEIIWPGFGFDYGSFYAAEDDMHVDIAGNIVDAVDLNTVHVYGTDMLLPVSWDLTFVRDAVPGTYSDAVPCGYLPTDVMGWCAFLPRATVTGTITVDGVVYIVDGASGYSDHNWGSPETFAYCPWAKAETDDGVIINGGAVPSMILPNRASTAFFNVWTGDEWVFFSPQVVYTWTTDPSTGLDYASKMTIRGLSTDKAWLMNLEITVDGEYMFDVLDFGPYLVGFFKSFDCTMTGKIRELSFPGILCPINVATSCVVEQNFFIVA